MSEHEPFNDTPDAAEVVPPEEDLPEFDFMDPLKREGQPGLDPIVPVIPPD